MDEEKWTINFSELPQETVIDDVVESQVPTESGPSVHGSEFEALKKEVVSKDFQSLDKKDGGGRISEVFLDELVAGIDKFSVLGTSTTKIPTLENFELPSYNESQIVALEMKTSVVITSEQEARNRTLGHGKSPFTDFSSTSSSTDTSPTYFHIEHPFTNYIGFAINNELTVEFEAWVK
ncbi:hypothetical protein RND71_006758 [Anisodus tanguticus]|uniref:Uncharacterized protein n=1 Tax=Anisodus tanguticus TaxID=243964 RepID=A0AAE1SUJ6_9SOLA|nr:hypothetical protein RND71_006758 [Anisodus tanguticus]